MDRRILNDLLERKGYFRLDEKIHMLLEELGCSKHYEQWMLTAPVAMDFELCRTESADMTLCCALLTALLREYHFDTFALQKRTDSGELDAVLRRMAEVGDQPILKSPPLFSLDELWQERCVQVPQESGVYYVLLPEGAPRIRTDLRGGYVSEDLEGRWRRSGGKCLYIGKASAKSGGLRTRLRQYMRCGYAGAKNHRGGRAIWQVEQQGELRISWQVSQQADELERRLLKRYREVFCCYPMANRRN